MMPKFVVAIASVATALATPVCGTGVYKQPKLSSFAVVSANLGLPVNTTTFDGITALFPLYKGSIAGKFKGHLVNSTSVVRERVLPGSDGAHSVVSTDLIFENEKEEHILVHMDGQTTYANKALHGFGRGLMQTDIAELKWVNWATFLIEWEGFFNTGEVVFEFSEVKTGGRRDGKAIPALGGR